MFKKAVRQGRSERKGEAYIVWYVEPLSDARTKLAVFFNTLLTEERSVTVGGLTLHPMKEIRVIVAGEHRAFVTELLDRVNATGYTIIGNVSGKGHHGVREAHFMFSEQESLEMIMTVVPEEKVEPVLAGLRPLFERHSGVMFVADVTVSRQEYFGKKGKGA